MKKHFRNFCVRGMTFAWTGPCNSCCRMALSGKGGHRFNAHGE